MSKMDKPLNSDPAPPGKRKKITVEQVEDLLLTPGSSRRRKAWQRLRQGDESRGLSQDQVSKYLESYIKKHYQQVRKEGALTYDKVQRYLDYLAKVGAESLQQQVMNQPKTERFADKLKPVVEAVGSKVQLTEADIKEHTREVKQQAADFIKENARPATPSTTEGLMRIEIKSAMEIFLAREIVPIGFEQGAPKVSVADFLQFPLAESESGPSPENPFAMHLRYLELACERSRFVREDLETIKQFLNKTPVKRYSTYFNIFPSSTYDDTALLVLYSQWRNKTLDRLLLRA